MEQAAFTVGVILGYRYQVSLSSCLSRNVDHLELNTRSYGDAENQLLLLNGYGDMSVGYCGYRVGVSQGKGDVKGNVVNANQSQTSDPPLSRILPKSCKRYLEKNKTVM